VAPHLFDCSSVFSEQRSCEAASRRLSQSFPLRRVIEFTRHGHRHSHTGTARLMRGILGGPSSLPPSRPPSPPLTSFRVGAAPRPCVLVLAGERPSSYAGGRARSLQPRMWRCLAFRHLTLPLARNLLNFVTQPLHVIT
jgi:hypothetical protein